LLPRSSFLCVAGANVPRQRSAIGSFVGAVSVRATRSADPTRAKGGSAREVGLKSVATV
jgi:hypothetical protein